MSKKNNLITSILLGLIFFVVLTLTLPDYGINWDTINHLPRGQVYLHYFLTGNRTFNDLEPYKRYWQKPEDLKPSSELKGKSGDLRSYYENEAFDFNWLMEVDGAGHAPLSDILASVFNKVLFGKFRLINDIDSYRIYGVLLASILVAILAYWSSNLYGTFSGVIAGLTLSMYPLYFSESHFNTEKDIPETTFWSLFLYSIWQGFIKKSYKWIIFSGILFGLALGTKLNIVFSVFVFVPWIIFYLGKKIIQKENLKLILSGAFALIIGLAIFYLTWPYIWQDLIEGTARFLGFYKLIGSGYVNFDPRFLGPFKINLYPIIWILYTTPVFVLLLCFVGIVCVIYDLIKRKKYKSDKYNTGLLFLLWLFVPIIRVIAPQAGIYGGVRQLMEYIPALAVIVAIGASRIVDFFKKPIYKKISIVSVLSMYVLLGYRLYEIHPNQNVFFNSLIGGLNGAKNSKVPSWGNSFGAAYRQGFVWLNNNAEKNSKAVFAHELMPNAPLIWVRPDINFFNTARSGFLRYGEYAISLTYDGTSTASYYDAYLENFLNPVYTSEVDGVAIIKVWKNDIEHTKPEYKKQLSIENIKWYKLKNGILVDLHKVYNLSHLNLQYTSKRCDETTPGSVRTSINGVDWNLSPETLPSGAIPANGQQPSKNNLFFPFLADKARYVKIEMGSDLSCLSSTTNVNVYNLPDLH